MSLTNKVHYRFPRQFACHLCSHIEINARNEEISTRSDESRNIDQALSGLFRFHVTEEAIGYHDIVESDRRAQLGVAGIAAYPCDSLLEPRTNTRSISLYLEHLLNFFF